MNDKEMSDLSVSRAECPKCGAVWINGQHYWSGTGKKGNELDLAGLVCNKLGNHQCINPRRGADGGDTWAKRLEDLQKNGPEMDKDMKDK
jgi:sRNA-binding protein